MTKRQIIEPTERETHITFNDSEKIASIFSIDPKCIRRLDRLVEKYPDAYKLDHEEDWCGNRACYYKVPSKLISFRKPSAPRTLSDEQRKAAAERIVTARLHRKQS